MKKLRKRDIQSIETRNRIKECANALFALKDYDLVKVVDICICAGVSTGAFYHHYQSKEEIINDTYNDFDISAENVMKGKAFDTRIEAILFLLYFQVKSIGDRGCIFTTCYFKNQLANQERNIINKERFFYRQLLKEVEGALEGGEIHYDSAEKLTDFLLRMTRGSIYNWCLHGGDYDLLEQTMEDVKWILGLYQRDSPCG